MDNIVMTTKENLPYLTFVASGIEQEAIVEKLVRARALGNQFKNKCKIFFNTSEGVKMVETTVWSMDEKHLLLKGNTTIPIFALVDIEF